MERHGGTLTDLPKTAIGRRRFEGDSVLEKKSYEIGSSYCSRMVVPTVSRNITRLVPQKAGRV
jgi:hypothetical protein